jgi:hypothetical protein
MDEARLIRAAQITLRRVIINRFPPGPERQKQLEWLAQAVINRPIILERRRLLAAHEL